MLGATNVCDAEKVKSISPPNEDGLVVAVVVALPSPQPISTFHVPPCCPVDPVPAMVIGPAIHCPVGATPFIEVTTMDGVQAKAVLGNVICANEMAMILIVSIVEVALLRNEAIVDVPMFINMF